jgi:predicted RNA-binding Zn ribbon-like protein
MMVYAHYTPYSASAELSTMPAVSASLRTDHEINPIPINPGRALCLDFVNSQFAEHTGSGQRFDRLALPRWWQWLAARWQLGLPSRLAPADARKLRQVRSRLRSMLERASRGQALGASDLAWVNRWLSRSPRRISVPAGTAEAGVRLAPVVRNWDAIIADVLLSFVALVRDGNPRRIRQCANESCSWMFYDDSRNRSRRWCDPHYCGNLIKVRRYRAKQEPR